MIDRKKLDRLFYLTVENISFASTAIGHATAGRTAATDWAANDEVVFKGKLKEILSFALMAFSVNQTAIVETFDIVDAAKYVDVPNLTTSDIVTAISLSPEDNEGIVLANDLTFMQNLTNNWRLGWTETRNIRLEEKADPTDKLLYRGSVLEALAYALQYPDAGTAPVYTLYNIALSEVGLNKGVAWEAITGANGPVELEPAHITLANMILGA